MFVALCNSCMTRHLPGWAYRHPLASPMAIRTVNLVPLEGATLVRESGPGAQSPVPRSRIQNAHPETGQGRSLANRSMRDPNPALFPSPADVCAFHGEQTMTWTSRLLARIGITAAALTAPLVLAAPALASPMRQDPWDSVAQCESGGNWSTNTGNGYSGGLQFARSTWRSFGGGAYASTASGASRAQQITIAEKVLHAQGWNAWPTCSRRAGVR